MSKDELKALLLKLELDKKDLADITKVSKRTIDGWFESRGKVPVWLEPFLELYEENKQLKKSKV